MVRRGLQGLRGLVFARRPFPGPTLAEVERTMARESLGGDPAHSKRASDQTSVTWKRIARAVQTQTKYCNNLEQLGKRKVGKNGAGESVGKKVRNQNDKPVKGNKFKLHDEDCEGTENGSGMVAAAEQPR